MNIELLLVYVYGKLISSYFAFVVLYLILLCLNCRQLQFFCIIFAILTYFIRVNISKGFVFLPCICFWFFICFSNSCRFIFLFNILWRSWPEFFILCEDIVHVLFLAADDTHNLVYFMGGELLGGRWIKVILILRHKFIKWIININPSQSC